MTLFVTICIIQVQPALASSNLYHKRAAYQALAVSAEGCQEHIRTKYLNNFLQVLGKYSNRFIIAAVQTFIYASARISELLRFLATDNAILVYLTQL